jgi:hypothetical protein
MVILTERGHTKISILAIGDWDGFQAALWCLRQGG